MDNRYTHETKPAETECINQDEKPNETTISRLFH